MTPKPFFKYYFPREGQGGDAIAFYGMPMLDRRRSAIAGKSIFDFSDVSAATLRARGFDVPETPTYEAWVTSGSPIFREPQSLQEVQGHAKIQNDPV